ncbi:MAG: hypothetical protein JWR38_3099 [Mucilaginibacter sp.]|nr:hypothetical protein [Mucilaginibacter sp.]
MLLPFLLLLWQRYNTPNRDVIIDHDIIVDNYQIML